MGAMALPGRHRAHGALLLAAVNRGPSRAVWQAVRSLPPDPSMSQPKPRGRHFSMLREFHLADWFTLANAFCGTGAVFAAMRFLQDGVVRDLMLGMALIPLAFVFDALDGRVARWRKVASTLGRELDSLADVISFGVAPAALAYACGMQGGWDWIILSYFVGCGVSRLARYNVTAETLAEGSDKVKYFEGTPIPSSLGLVIVLAVMAWQGRLGEAIWFGQLQLGPGSVL